MAAGDLTRDSGKNPQSTGAEMVLTGTIEVDNTYRAYALLGTTSYITSCMLMDEDGSGSIEVDLNVNASGTETLGTIACAGNHVSVETYRYRCTFTGM